VSKCLVIGDVHAVPQELPDCEALWRLVVETAEKYRVDSILLLGDLHNTHDILNTRVIDFWLSSFSTYASNGIPISLLVGNHDQLTPTIRNPHSLQAYENLCEVVDKPCKIESTYEACAMPYYANPVEFIEDAVKLKAEYPDVDTLFCHQTFSGADQALGFYSQAYAFWEGVVRWGPEVENVDRC
jgi:DNA repair exonuclease SbcCD nuclease subunit